MRPLSKLSQKVQCYAGCFICTRKLERQHQRHDERYLFSLLRNDSVNSSNLQRTWVQLINTRGCNPFLHKVALYLTNYHAAISMHKIRGGLMADYYDIQLFS